MDVNIVQQERIDLEDQFILRLPSMEAEKVHEILRSKPERIKKFLKIDLNPEKHLGTVYCGKKVLKGILKKIPTIVESYKTNLCNNKSFLVKTADICQVLQCYYEDIDKEEFEYRHGMTPPLKNVNKRRFRKTLRNSEEAIEVETITKELYYLLRTDCEAVSTRYQIFQEETNKSSNVDSEMVLFGHVSSDSEVSES